MNTFYDAFDYENFGPDRSADYRTPFQVDRDRILYSVAFRRLQAKTQVFLSGEYDFYRTRLTHSLEVAQIGRSICNWLEQNSDLLSADFYVDRDLVEAVCLAHDIGHPPFGHAGEATLNQLMRNFGGFEGNAQTLRIITETIYGEAVGHSGMKPTRAFTDGVLKYKTTYANSTKDRHFLYEDQKKYVDFIFDQKSTPPELADASNINAFRSLECQIMDWADDTAYSLNDIVDGINAGFISIHHIEQWAASTDLDRTQSGYVEKILQAIRDGQVERTFALKIGTFIQATTLQERQNFLSGKTNRYKFEVVVDDEIRAECKLYKSLSRKIVFESPKLQQIEHKDGFMLSRIFDAFVAQYIDETDSQLNLLPNDYEQHVRSELNQNTKARLLCDHISSMTDGLAIRTYKRLFDPDFGSIMDLV